MRDAAHSAWEEVSLGDLVAADWSTAAHHQPTSQPTGRGAFLGSQELTSLPPACPNFTSFVSDDAVRQTATNVIAKGQLLLVTRTGVGKLAITPCDVAISQDITGVYPDLKRVAISPLPPHAARGGESQEA